MKIVALNLVAALLVAGGARSQDVPAPRDRAGHERLLGELERELATLATRPDDAREMALRTRAGNRLQDLERFAESRQHYARAAELAREHDERQLLLVLLANLAISDFYVGELERGLAASEEAMQLAEELERPDRLWSLASNAGSIQLHLGNYADAARSLTRALQVQPDDTGPGALGLLLSNLGVAHMYLGDHREALGLFDRALPHMREAADQTGIAAVLANQGDIHHLLGDDARALPLLRQALALRRAHDGECAQSLSLRSLGTVLGALGQAEESLAALQQALAIQERLGLRVQRAATLAALADVYALLDRGAEALPIAQQGLDLADQSKTRARRLANLDALARAHQANGDFEQAVEVVQQARELERELTGEQARAAFAAARNQLELELRARELAALRQENEIQRLQRNLFLVSAIGLAVLAVLGWLLFLIKRRGMRRLDAALDELRRANHLAGERAADLERAMTEIRNLEDERLRTSRLESISILAAGIAHDFNNILTSLLCNVSLARDTLKDRSAEREILDDAMVAADQARRLANQLLAFAKGGEPHRELRGLAQLTRDAATMAASGSNVTLRFDLSANLWPALVDEGQLSQVLSNLVINAVQAMPAGGTITVSAHNLPGSAVAAEGSPGREPRVRIRIHDSGPGIDPAAREKIFDPYFSTKDAGHGLGLTTAHAIVDRHGGTLELEDVGHGTCFAVLLPAEPDVELPRPDLPRTAPLTEQERVLVVDDDPTVRKVYARALKALSMDFEIVATAAEAVTAFSAARDHDRGFRILLLDLTMPGAKDGAAILADLRAIDPTVRAVVASGYSDAAVMAHHAQAGFDAALPKPFTVRALAAALQSATANANTTAIEH